MRRTVLPALAMACTVLCATLGFAACAAAQAQRPRRLASDSRSSSRAPRATRRTPSVIGSGWTRLVKVLRDGSSTTARHLIVLAEKAGADEQRATAEVTRAVLAKLATALKPADQLFIMFIGHGGGEGDRREVQPGGARPERGGMERAPEAGRRRASRSWTPTSASFPYLAGLAAPGRVVITATNSFAQRFHTEFPEGFIQAFGTDAADADKNGRISLLEAFTYASRLVAQHYEQSGTMATEKAVLDDTGDGKGAMPPARAPTGRSPASRIWTRRRWRRSSNPEVQQLLQRQQALTEQVDELRRRQPTMPPAEFDREFERLIIDLATVSREVRRRSGA